MNGMCDLRFSLTFSATHILEEHLENCFPNDFSPRYSLHKHSKHTKTTPKATSPPFRTSSPRNPHQRHFKPEFHAHPTQQTTQLLSPRVRNRFPRTFRQAPRTYVPGQVRFSAKLAPAPNTVRLPLFSWHIRMSLRHSSTAALRSALEARYSSASVTCAARRRADLTELSEWPRAVFELKLKRIFRRLAKMHAVLFQEISK